MKGSGSRRFAKPLSWLQCGEASSSEYRTEKKEQPDN
jgi:hypothetical protein